MSEYMENKLKIAIGIPTQGNIKAKTALSLMETIRLNPSIEFLPVFQHGNIISENREKLVKIAQDNLCSHIFFVDSDIAFEPDTLSKLLDQDKDIIGTDYNYRFLPLTSTVKFYESEISGIGMGCALIKMSVFDKLSKPYFPTEFDENGIMVCGEDIGFCEKAGKAGFKIYCDTTIKINHIGDYLF